MRTGRRSGSSRQWSSGSRGHSDCCAARGRGLQRRVRHGGDAVEPFARVGAAVSASRSSSLWRRVLRPRVRCTVCSVTVQRAATAPRLVAFDRRRGRPPRVAHVSTARRPSGRSAVGVGHKRLEPRRRAARAVPAVRPPFRPRGHGRLRRGRPRRTRAARRCPRRSRGGPAQWPGCPCGRLDLAGGTVRASRRARRAASRSASDRRTRNRRPPALGLRSAS